MSFLPLSCPNFIHGPIHSSSTWFRVRTSWIEDNLHSHSHCLFKHKRERSPLLHVGCCSSLVRVTHRDETWKDVATLLASFLLSKMIIFFLVSNSVEPDLSGFLFCFTLFSHLTQSWWTENHINWMLDIHTWEWEGP